MASTALPPAHGALLPRPPGGNGRGALLALVVHAVLLAALTVSVDWRSTSPDVVAAELWAQVPQAAAPRAETPPPPEPTPTPAPTPAPTPTPAPPPPAPRPDTTEPDIAVERRKAEAARKKAEAAAQAERERAAAAKAEAERERAAKAEAERKKTEAAERKKAEEQAKRKQAEQARAEEEKLAQQRARNLERIMGQAGGATGTGGRGTAAVDAAPSSAYGGRIAAMIRRSLVFTGSVPDNVAAEVEVRTAPGGTILSRRLVKSSGHPEWDEAVLRAIDKTPRLPPDTDGRVPTALTLVFRPNE